MSEGIGIGIGVLLGLLFLFLVSLFILFVLFDNSTKDMTASNCVLSGNTWHNEKLQCSCDIKEGIIFNKDPCPSGFQCVHGVCEH